MREIKFRQWIINSFHYWGFLEDGVFIGPANSSDGNFYDSQQFTGLLDKLGNEIYEGDIVKHYGFGNSWIITFGEYRRPNFMNGDKQQKHLGFYGKPISNYDEKNNIEYNNSNVSLLGEDFRNGIEVIGNIYEQTKA